MTDWSIAYKVKPSGAPDIHEFESDLVAYQEDETSAQINIDLTNEEGENLDLVDGTIVEEVSIDELRRGVSDANDDDDEEEDDAHDDDDEEEDVGEESCDSDSEEVQSERSNSDDELH